MRRLVKTRRPPAAPSARRSTKVFAATLFTWSLGALGACATTPPGPQNPLPAWDEPQPQCYLGDAIAGSHMGTQTNDGIDAIEANMSMDGKSTIARSEVANVVHAHLDEVRYCYKKGLELDPQLQGDVVIRFTVGRGGHVLSSSVASSTLADFDVQACVARAVCRWLFESPPAGAKVAVTYPFTLVATRPVSQEP